jgi:hypothetical protein
VYEYGDQLGVIATGAFDANTYWNILLANASATYIFSPLGSNTDD